MFDYKLLEALAVTIEEEGFEKASRVLNISQSAVSQRIKLLEEDQGQILITRTTPPVATRRGHALVSHYRQVKLLENEINETTTDQATVPVTFSIGINADSLSTWFLPAITSFLLENRILLDLHVDDQEQTFNLLKKGLVWGCISTRDKTAHGCNLVPIGTMKYILCCTPFFMEHYFPHGVTLDSVAHAPMARFNRKDSLNDQFFESFFNRKPRHRPEHLLPSSEKYLELVLSGTAYGIVPFLQCKKMIESKRLIHLSPDHEFAIPLYWHSWKITSRLMRSFSDHLIKNSFIF